MTKGPQKILLGVCGSISAYKSYDLLRELKRLGHQVKVVLTKGANHFVHKETYLYLGADEVFNYDDDFLQSSQEIIHIELARWCEIFVMAPLSANTLSELTLAGAKDLITSTFLALGNKEIPKLFFPAMNTKMLEHPFVQRNLNELKQLSNCFIHPTNKGLMACLEQGEGRLAEIEQMTSLITTFMPIKQNQRHFLITTGATLAPLDPVRYLTNRSSGQTGFELAKQALIKGHKVSVIAGVESTTNLDSLLDHPDFELQRVVTNDQMKEAVFGKYSQTDFYISSAAISDIKFEPLDEKLKKSQLKRSLKIETDTDILQEVLNKKNEQVIVGFAAETNLSHEVLLEKMKRKPVDLLIGTKVHSGFCGDSQAQGFKNATAKYLIAKKINSQISVDQEYIEKSKVDLSEMIINYCLDKSEGQTSND